ncbi:unnamed protein product [Clonostachys rosea f. rosea IK726]|uniref:Uncharacterized protein n=1 Tax=Clonostachys rosea f. rosea IK726 TaxID=1349383 RepID=A0ACA9TJ52_BIOOC|nr:unnamed protein product [Clonostachys rosea f. rosea IK726]
MRQTCLCQHLRIKCDHPDTLRQLPVSIRERIYRHAGLIAGHRLIYGDPLEDDDTLLLMRICHQIRNEVEALISKHNAWAFTISIEETLLSLRGWTPEACARLHDVHVDVRTSEYSPVTWSLIRAWQGAAKHLLQHAKPGQLRLHVICHVGDDVARARAVVKPFEQFPGRLKELELCLANYALPDLLKLARETVAWAQAPDEEDAHRANHPFPFFSLPQEIRHHIFQYTGLVLPHRNVLWLPDGYGFRRQYIWCECDGTVCRERDLHHNQKFYRCDLEDDFCARRSSSFSTSCKHEAALSLLLASRALYQEAIAFFYASNRITIAARDHPEHAISMWDPTRSPPPREDDWNVPNWEREESDSAEQITHDPTRLFIKHIGTAVLRHLRNIEIVLPMTTTNSSLDDKLSIYTEWLEAVDLLAEHCNVAALTISIHVFTMRRYFRRPLSITEDIRQTQSLRMINPLKRLSGLGRLFVLLEWPHHWSSLSPRLDIESSGMPKKPSPGCGIGEHFIPSSEPILMQEETQLERQIMGEQYDSFAVGKRELLPSPLLRRDWNSSMG